MEYLYDYLGFLARAVTVVLAVLVVLGFLFANAGRRGVTPQGALEVKHLNEELKDLKQQLSGATVSEAERKQLEKALRKEDKARAKAEAKAAKARRKQPRSESRPETAGESSPGESATDAAGNDGQTGRVFVLTFKGDIQASSVDQLRREITGVLTVAEQADEVVVRLESAGGLVHAYGLAASQLQRIRDAGVALTVTVDQVAASGGYLMAAVAERILAAPFAVVGSIGVVAQVPNVHRLLKKNDVDVDLITAGQYKRTLTVFGENTDEGRRKFEEQLEDVHALFQEFIKEARPVLDLAQVATGESWYGRRALDLALIDELQTSDSYLVGCATTREVFEITWRAPKNPLQRLLAEGARLSAGLGRLLRPVQLPGGLT